MNRITSPLFWIGLVLLAGVVFVLFVGARSATPPVVEVPVAIGDVPPGTEISTRLFRLEKWSGVQSRTLDEYVTRNGFGPYVGAVTVETVHAGFPLGKAQVVQAGEANPRIQRLSLMVREQEGQVVFALPVEADSAGNYVQAGDYVDLVFSVGSVNARQMDDPPDPTPTPPAIGISAGPPGMGPEVAQPTPTPTPEVTETLRLPVTKLVIQNVPVLRVERETVRSGASASPSVGLGSTSQSQPAFVEGDVERLYVAMPPIVANVEACVATIRRFRPVARNLDELLGLGTLTPAIANFLRAAVQAKLNVAVSGGTGSGKTTFLQSLSSAMPDLDRVVTVEDTPELNLHHVQDWIQLITRKEAEGVGAITMRHLVRDTLRMRPERIILGEARGPEMVDILVAMNTGHDGVLFTVHANDVRDTFERIETMYLMGQDLPLVAVRRQIVNALDLIVHLVRERDRRYVSGIGEVRRLEMEQPVIETIFEYDPARGQAVYAGLVPACRERLEQAAPGFDFRRDVAALDRRT